MSEDFDWFGFPNVRHGLLSRSQSPQLRFFIRSRKYSQVSKIWKSPILGEKQTNRPILWQALTMRLVVDIFGLLIFPSIFSSELKRIDPGNCTYECQSTMFTLVGVDQANPKAPNCSTDLLSLRTHWTFSKTPFALRTQFITVLLTRRQTWYVDRIFFRIQKRGCGLSERVVQVTTGVIDVAGQMGLVGLEPTISPLWAVRFNQLNYKPLRSMQSLREERTERGDLCSICFFLFPGPPEGFFGKPY